ncbi:MAG: hypothetical protein AAFQ08_02860 [Bacteroidota bacterium]
MNILLLLGCSLLFACQTPVSEQSSQEAKPKVVEQSASDASFSVAMNKAMAAAEQTQTAKTADNGLVPLSFVPLYGYALSS